MGRRYVYTKEDRKTWTEADCLKLHIIGFRFGAHSLTAGQVKSHICGKQEE